MEILLVIGTFLAVFGLIGLFIFVGEDDEMTIVTALMLVGGMIMIIVGLLIPSTSDKWFNSDAVVNQVVRSTDGEGVFILTDKGNTLHCMDSSQCAKLEHGDHITFQQKDSGTVKDVPDIQQVVKG